jgi:hypothetical protein
VEHDGEYERHGHDGDLLYGGKFFHRSGVVAWSEVDTKGKEADVSRKNAE